MSEAVWYVGIAGQQAGPFTIEQVEQAARGQDPAGIKVWRQGLPGWLDAPQVPEVMAVLVRPAPAPAPVPAPMAAPMPAPTPTPVPRTAADVPAKAAPQVVPKTAEGPAKAAPAPAPSHAAMSPAPAAPSHASPSPSALSPTPAPVAQAAPAAGHTFAEAPARDPGAVSASVRRLDAPVVASSPGIFGPFMALLRPLFPENVPTRFAQPFRVEGRDAWAAFKVGMDPTRISVMIVAFLGSALVAGVLLGLGYVFARYINITLGYPFLAAAGLAVIAITCVAMGALAFHQKAILLGQTPPTVGETLTLARSRPVALGLTPVIVAIATLVPATVVGALGFLLKIPVAGPLVNGILFGPHLLLSAATIFLALATLLSITFAPAIVALEETSPKETINVLFDFVRRSFVRTIIRGILPSLVYLLVVLPIVAGLGFAVVSLAVTLLTKTGGMEWMIATDAEGRMTGMSLGFTLGRIPAGIWVALFASGVLGVITSVGSALSCFLYLTGRRGNDDLPAREGA